MPFDIVDCADVVRIQGADDYAELLVSDGRRLLQDAGLAALEHRLPSHFVRTHRSHIVNAAMPLPSYAQPSASV